MEANLYNEFLLCFESLNTKQYKTLKARIKEKDNKRRNAISLEKSKLMFCPHCKSESFINWGFRSDLQRYKCKKCNKTFNQLTSTPLARLKKKGRWLEFSDCLKNGFSVRESASLCCVNKNTAFKWRHRFLENAKHIKPQNLNGVVEISETYFAYSEKGKKSSSSAKKKIKKRKNPVCVVVSRDRNKNTSEIILSKLNSGELQLNFLPKLGKDVLICSDSKAPYKQFATSCNLRQGRLNLSKGVEVVKDVVHVRNVSAYHMNLRSWMIRFRGVATKYLQSYLSWYRELDEFNMEIPAIEFLVRAKKVKPYFHQP